MPENDDAVGTTSALIAEFVAGFDLARAPAPAAGLAETALLDTIGVMLAGSREPAARIARDMVAAEGAAPRATVAGSRLRSSPAGAALANGVATQALDFDLSFMIGQSAAALFPGLLPLAETRDAGPGELLAAYIVGCEVCARIARSFPTLSSEGGLHGAGVIGAVAAAAAFARMTQQPAERIPAILGLAASMAAGLGVNFGTMTKPLHAGLAARNAMTALMLSERGFTASPAALDGPEGFFAVLARGLPWDTRPFDDLGREFALVDPGYKIKPFPCGGLMHCPIEAALAIRAESKLPPDDIARITVGVTRHARDRAIDRYPWSEDSARFSLRYLIATALVHGAVTLSAFRADAIADKTVEALAARCETVADEAFAHVTGSGYSPARVTIALADGRRLEKTVEVAVGARTTPMGEDRIREKFLSCAGRALGESAASELYAYLRNIRRQPTLGDLWPMLAADDA